MGLFYKLSSKKLLEIRNEMFVKFGIPILKRRGFEEMPFQAPWFGRNNLGDYTYELCRLNERQHLEIITTEISKGDLWIKIFLNIFELKPELNSLEQLKGLPIIQFYLPPNSLTEMRLRIHGIKVIPLFNTVKHKIKSFYTKRGLERRVKNLQRLIESDLNDIDSFIKRWYELHKPMVTNWEGKKIDDNLTGK